ncbi:hypothetical protein ACI195_005068, partial [Escherichia coli]
WLRFGEIMRGSLRVKQQRVECRGEWFINFYMRYKQQH